MKSAIKKTKAIKHAKVNSPKNLEKVLTGFLVTTRNMKDGNQTDTTQSGGKITKDD